MFYLYTITDTLNNKVYIGQTVNPKTRWSQHKSISKRDKPIQYIHRAIAKYGIGNFSYEVIAMSKTQEDADITETILINQYNSRNKEFGYNLSPGGDVAWNRGLPTEQQPMYGKHHSEESKKKISEGNIGKIMPPHSDEWKENMSKIFSGRILTDDWKQKLSDSNKGLRRSEETRNRISKALSDRVVSTETKEKMSKSHLGKLKSDETKKRMSTSMSGENTHLAKLTWDIVNKIREEYKRGNITQRDLAKKYGITKSNVYFIISNRSWKV